MSYTVQAANPFASATVAGIVSTGPQTFGGDKTFNGTVLALAAGGGYALKLNAGAYVSFNHGVDTALLTYTAASFASGALQTAIAFASNANAGVVGLGLAQAGARLKLSSGGTTDYLSSNGTTKISAAGDFGVDGDLYFNNSSTGILRGAAGAGLLRIDNTVGFQFLYGSNVFTMNSVDAAWTIPAGKFSITGDTTSPAKAAFQLVPQDTQPSGPNAVGDLYMTAAGVLKVCTAAGSPGTWVSVGAQT